MEYPHYENRERAAAAVRGKASRLTGNLFEQMIDQTCIWYAEQGIAVIEKTPEPMRPISKPNRAGQFQACFIKQAQPDYKKNNNASWKPITIWVRLPLCWYRLECSSFTVSLGQYGAI